jgi:hypothetical protein
MKSSALWSILLSVLALMKRIIQELRADFSEWAGIPATGKKFSFLGFAMMKVYLWSLRSILIID